MKAGGEHIISIFVPVSNTIQVLIRIDIDYLMTSLWHISTSVEIAFCSHIGCSVVFHYDDVIMSAIASQVTSLTIVYSAVYPGADQSKHQSSASLAFVWGIHRRSVNSPHKWPVTRKLLPFDDVIMCFEMLHAAWQLYWCGLYKIM